jgi:glycosyltransferase involved in cell wall biosynthesis
VSQPRVSIAVATYKQAHCVGRAIASAFAQDYDNLEVVVCDDASPDETPDVVSRFASYTRLRQVRRPHNLGRAGNYRQALRDCAGEWVLMLDGDDWIIDPAYISNVMRELPRHEQVVLACAGTRMMWPDGRYKDAQVTRSQWEMKAGSDYFLAWGAWLGPAHQSSLYPRQLAIELDFYRSDIISSDWESLRRLVLRGNVLLHGRPVSVWQRHAAGASASTDVASRIADLQGIQLPYEDAKLFGINVAKLDAWRRETVAAYALDQLRTALIAGHEADAFALLAYVREHDPEAYVICRRRIALNPPLWWLIGMSRLGATRLAAWPAETWHKLTTHRLAQAKS